MRFGRRFVLMCLALLAGCAQPMMQPRGESAVAPYLTEDRIVAADGAVLPMSVWTPAAKPSAVVLALHGFNDYRNAFAELGPFLAKRGIAVYAYDQRGFGATCQRGIWPGEALLAEDLRTVAGLVRHKHRGIPLYLVGESMGGALAMSVLAETPEVADGTVLVAAAVWGQATMNPLQSGLLWLAAHSFPAMRLSGQGLGIRASDNDAMLRAQHDDPLVQKDARADTLWGLVNLMDRALLAAPGLMVPALVLYGERDEIIPRRPTCQMLARLNESARVAVYPNGYHMLTRDLGARLVLDDLAAWLADPTAPLPSGFGPDGALALCTDEKA
jgi:alpha-beta hydrolase superfamily lysophospholipase